MHERIKKRFQEISSLPIESISFLSCGACNELYRIDCLDGQILTMKSKRKDKLDNELNDLKTEFNLLKAIQSFSQAPLSPYVIECALDGDAYVYKFIQGETLDQCWEHLNNTTRMEIYFNLGVYLANLHSATVLIQALNIPVNNDLEIINSRIVRFQSLLSEMLGDEHNLVGVCGKLLSAVDGSFADRKVFIHGDIHGGNILITDSKISGILDFGKSRFGNVYDDFSHLVPQHPEYLDSLIKGYGSVSELLIDRKLVLKHAITMDIEKVLYHVERLKIGTNKIINKMNQEDFSTLFQANM